MDPIDVRIGLMVVTCFNGLTKNSTKLTDDKHTKPQSPNYGWDPWPQDYNKDLLGTQLLIVSLIMNCRSVSMLGKINCNRDTTQLSHKFHRRDTANKRD